MESEKSGFVNEMSEIWRKMQVKTLIVLYFFAAGEGSVASSLAFQWSLVGACLSLLITVVSVINKTSN